MLQTLSLGELLNNSLKDLFPDQRAGRIEISFDFEPNRPLMLIVKGDGMAIKSQTLVQKIGLCPLWW